jgi:hypothetical protein
MTLLVEGKKKRWFSFTCPADTERILQELSLRLLGGSESASVRASATSMTVECRLYLLRPGGCPDLRLLFDVPAERDCILRELRKQLSAQPLQKG